MRALPSSENLESAQHIVKLRGERSSLLRKPGRIAAEQLSIRRQAHAGLEQLSRHCLCADDSTLELILTPKQQTLAHEV
jgi:hypothetical protein